MSLWRGKRERRRLTAENSSKPKGKVYALPSARRQKDGGVPKLTALKSKAQTGRFAKARVSALPVSS